MKWPGGGGGGVGKPTAVHCIWPTCVNTVRLPIAAIVAPRVFGSVYPIHRLHVVHCSTALIRDVNPAHYRGPRLPMPAECLGSVRGFFVTLSDFHHPPTSQPRMETFLAAATIMIGLAVAYLYVSLCPIKTRKFVEYFRLPRVAMDRWLDTSLSLVVPHMLNTGPSTLNSKDHFIYNKFTKVSIANVSKLCKSNFMGRKCKKLLTYQSTIFSPWIDQPFWCNFHNVLLGE